MSGVWVAYYGDFSEVVIFADEMECLRYAVREKMEVGNVSFGAPLHEALNHS